ncbi:Uncharacterised protein [Mycoplasmopsis edwardii]|uniref:Uncharacterized protein n=1 Tax=Mycoplasmopsis edwardii TaxID=53558 RepID=A0A3B0Q8E8_9BACT|nr:Uncharacterised protein [Mycoplasmopsis edwardii]
MKLREPIIKITILNIVDFRLLLSLLVKNEQRPPTKPNPNITIVNIKVHSL